MNPKEQLKAMLWMENKQVPQMIIYHSHPQGPARLSETDLAEAYFPEAIYMLWHSPAERWKVQLYWLSNRVWVEIPLVVR